MADRSCAAIVRNGFVLMVRQTYRVETFWTFPGGRIEENETAEQCAVREVHEETGLEIKITGLVCERFSERLQGTYYCFLGEIVGGHAELGSDPELSQDKQVLHELSWFPVIEIEDHPEVNRILPHL